MATVPELKAIARELGITGYSALRKPELEAAIARKRDEIEQTVSEALGTAESDSNKIDTADPTPTPTAELSRAERASRAGACGASALPMSNSERMSHYQTQHSLTHKRMRVGYVATPAQSRRMRKNANKAMR